MTRDDHGAHQGYHVDLTSGTDTNFLPTSWFSRKSSLPIDEYLDTNDHAKDTYHDAPPSIASSTAPPQNALNPSLLGSHGKFQYQDVKKNRLSRTGDSIVRDNVHIPGNPPLYFSIRVLHTSWDPTRVPSPSTSTRILPFT